jgi:hypothetical protein
MDQRIRISASLTPSGPIHRACVVRGCWCGASTVLAPAKPTRGRSTARVLSRIDWAGSGLTDIALRSVGLPVV